MDYQLKIMRELTAFHESGHAVAAWFCGARLKEVELTDVDKGICRFNHPGLNFFRHDSVDHPEVVAATFITLAGIAAATRKALQLGDPEGIWDCDAGHDDLVLCMSRLSMIDPSCGVVEMGAEEFYKQYGGPARWFPYESGVWAAIEAVAASLLERKKLSGQEAVREILAVWNGKPLPEKALGLELHQKEVSNVG